MLSVLICSFINLSSSYHIYFIQPQDAQWIAYNLALQLEVS